MSIFIALVLLPSKWEWLFFLIPPFIAFSQGMSNPNMVAIISSITSPREQGEMMGIQQSVQSLALSIPPLIAGFLLNIDFRLPILASSFFIFIGWLIITLFRKKIETQILEVKEELI